MSRAQIETAFAGHMAILDALKQHDPGKARAAMEEHLERGGRHAIELLAVGSDGLNNTPYVDESSQDSCFRHVHICCLTGNA